MNCFGNAVKRSNEAGNHQHHHQGKDESSSENIVSQAGPSGEVNKKSRLEVLQRDSKKSVNPITSTSELENDVTGNGTTNGSERPPQLREFTLAEMKLATKNFHYHNVIGEGGFGKVYKGVIKQKSKLHDGELEKVEVAVKQLNNNGFQVPIYLLHNALLLFISISIYIYTHLSLSFFWKRERLIIKRLYTKVVVLSS